MRKIQESMTLIESDGAREKYKEAIHIYLRSTFPGVVIDIIGSYLYYPEISQILAVSPAQRVELVKSIPPLRVAVAGIYQQARQSAEEESKLDSKGEESVLNGDEVSLTMPEDIFAQDVVGALEQKMRQNVGSEDKEMTWIGAVEAQVRTQERSRHIYSGVRACARYVRNNPIKTAFFYLAYLIFQFGLAFGVVSAGESANLDGNVTALLTLGALVLSSGITLHVTLGCNRSTYVNFAQNGLNRHLPCLFSFDTVEEQRLRLVSAAELEEVLLPGEEDEETFGMDHS